MIEHALYTYLTGVSAVNAIIGNRLYPNVMPQEATLPAIVFATITSTVEHGHEGSNSLYRALIQMDLYADEEAGGFDTVRSLAKAVVAALQGVKGATWGGVAVSAILVEEAGAAHYDSETDEFRIVVDVRVWYTNS